MADQSTGPKPKRLLDDLDDDTPPPAPIPQQSMADAASRFAGRPVPPSAPAPLQQPVATSELTIINRERNLLGRDHPFSVKLRLETRNAIKDTANRRNIPVAQVIEEAMAALFAKDN
ncbi:MAG: hypothetical protein B7Y99_02520 [Caulobacterales bacterium 32-69-10]|nr:MAG: hypothetical protein B7Y99_02520 [Caulobacterales bacterium 32-69-10]